MLKICKKTWILLTSVMILMFAATAFAAQEPDYDDPDYVKRILSVTEKEEEILSNTSSGQESAFTGSTYTHADIYTSGDYEILQGVDVSKWSATVNWTKVKNAGMSFAFIRAGYTSMSSSFSRNTDPYYSKNLKNAKAAGLKVGIYYFSQAITEAEAKKEANYTLELLDGAELDYPVVFDMEALIGGRLYKAVKNGKVSKRKAVKICQAYCDIISAAGYDVMIYTNKNHLEKVFSVQKLFAAFDNFWLARYNTIAHTSSDCSTYQKDGRTTLDNFFHNGGYEFWQYTDSGKVSGISNAADCSFQYVKKSGTEETTEEETTEEETTEEETEEETTEEETEVVGDDPALNPSKVTGVVSVSASVTSVDLTWDAVAEADSCEIWRSSSYDGTYKRITAVTGTSYTDQDLSECREYYYKIRAKRTVDGVTYYGAYSSVKSGRTKMAASAQVKTTKKTALYKKAGTSYEKLKTVAKGIKLTLKSVTKDSEGVSWYRVKTSSGVTGYVSSECAVQLVKKVSSVKAASRKSTSIKISWKAQSAVTGYQIYRSSAKNGKYKKIATVKSPTASYTDSGLSKYCQYYYKIRAYSKRDGVVTYGSFSSVTELATKATSFKAKTTGSVYVRKYAGSSYKKLTVLKKGKRVKVTLRTKDKNGKWWYKVSVKNGKKIYKGYVSAAYLKKVK